MAQKKIEKITGVKMTSSNGLNIDDFNNKNILASIRHALIRLIAGKHVVILNASIRIVPRDGDFCGSIYGINHGALLINSGFPVTDDLMLEITENGDRKKASR